MLEKLFGKRSTGIVWIVTASILLLLLAGFVCGNAWPLFCTALGCFLSPAAVCLPLAQFSAPQGGEDA